jgi:mitochondrial chaperone BCS1
MLSNFWNYVQELLQNNQIFSGGLLLMVGGAMLAYCRSVPSRIYQFVRRQLITQIDILDRDQSFEWVEKWLAQHAYSRKRARALTIKTESINYEERRDNPTMDARPRILFAPAPGVHWFFFKRRLIYLHRERPKMSESSTQTAIARECFNITIFSRNRRLARDLIEEAREVAMPKNDVKLTIHRGSFSYWSEQMKRLPRPPESVILANGMLEELIEDTRTFLTRRQWYHDRGIPYRRGYLLYGPPGTGKSSAVVAVASALGMDIAMLSLGDSSLEDSNLSELFCNIPINSIVLMEDIDCAFAERKGTEDKRSKVTFSGLLNAIDGVAAGEGRMLFATTNHLERLDPALIRPGRIDRKYYVGYASREQAARLFGRFFPSADREFSEMFAEQIPENAITMSSLQTHLLLYAYDPDLAIRREGELADQVSSEMRQDTLVCSAP